MSEYSENWYYRSMLRSREGMGSMHPDYLRSTPDRPIAGLRMYCAGDNTAPRKGWTVRNWDTNCVCPHLETVWKHQCRSTKNHRRMCKSILEVNCLSLPRSPGIFDRVFTNGNLIVAIEIQVFRIAGMKPLAGGGGVNAFGKVGTINPLGIFCRLFIGAEETIDFIIPRYLRVFRLHSVPRLTGYHCRTG